jgi:gas vesicle protein
MMDNKNFKKGLVLGGILGGLAVAFGMSKKGKELQNKAADYAQELYKEVQAKMAELGDSSKELYADLVKRSVDEFAKRKGMALEMKEDIVEKLRDKWNEMQMEMLFKKVKNRFADAAEKTQEEFENIVHAVADEYENAKDVAGYAKYRIVRDLKKRWNEVNDTKEENDKKGW